MKKQQLKCNYDRDNDHDAKIIRLKLDRIAEDIYKSTDNLFDDKKDKMDIEVKDFNDDYLQTYHNKNLLEPEFPTE